MWTSKIDVSWVATWQIVHLLLIQNRWYSIEDNGQRKQSFSCSFMYGVRDRSDNVDFCNKKHVNTEIHVESIRMSYMIKKRVRKRRIQWDKQQINEKDIIKWLRTGKGQTGMVHQILGLTVPKEMGNREEQDVSVNSESGPITKETSSAIRWIHQLSGEDYKGERSYK